MAEEREIGAITHYFGKVAITSEDTKKTRDVGNLYTDGAVNNIATFHQSITTGL